jgi:dinuclear metal center YbgI/SA1388 family protein
VHFAVDPTLAVVREAASAGAQLLVTHHPLMLRGVTSVAATTAKGAVVHELIQAGIAQFAAHTNADAATRGVADALAYVIGMEGAEPLIPHPSRPGIGTGRVGTVAATTLEALAEVLARGLPTTAQGVLFAGDPSMPVRTVAVVGGAGDAYIDAAVSCGADVYITADLRHHPVLEAREAATVRDGRPAFINVSHSASESVWLASAAQHVAAATGVAVHVSTLNTDPWTGHIASPRT